jgi:hypothetical protein
MAGTPADLLTEIDPSIDAVDAAHPRCRRPLHNPPPA